MAFPFFSRRRKAGLISGLPHQAACLNWLEIQFRGTSSSGQFTPERLEAFAESPLQALLDLAGALGFQPELHEKFPDGYPAR